MPLLWELIVIIIDKVMGNIGCNETIIIAYSGDVDSSTLSPEGGAMIVAIIIYSCTKLREE